MTQKPTALLAVAALGALLDARIAAQYGRAVDRYPSEWESDRFRVRRLALAPRTPVTEPDGADAVMVFLTADLDGRMPPAEAIWQPGGQRTLENRGRARFEAILLELKDGPAGAAAITPPEAFPTSDRITVWRLIDNPRVLVTKHRYPPVTAVDPLHFHPQDTLVVYLKGGYVWRAHESSRGRYLWPMPGWPMIRGSYAHRVSRGDVDLLPANTFHAFSNAGGDPLEFVVLFFK